MLFGFIKCAKINFKVWEKKLKNQNKIIFIIRHYFFCAQKIFLGVLTSTGKKPRFTQSHFL